MLLFIVRLMVIELISMVSIFRCIFSNCMLVRIVVIGSNDGIMFNRFSFILLINSIIIKVIEIVVKL